MHEESSQGGNKTLPWNYHDREYNINIMNPNERRHWQKKSFLSNLKSADIYLESYAYDI